MTQVASIDFSLKRIYLHLDTVTNGFDGTSAHFDIKALIQANTTYQGYPAPTSAEGNQPKGGGRSVPRYLFLAAGWRLVAYDQVSHELRLLCEVISADELTDRDVFDRSTLSPTIYVDITPAYDKIEIREVNGLSDSDGDAIAVKVWGYDRNA